MEYSQNWKKLKQDLQTGNIHARRQKRHNENGCGLERKKKKKQFKRDNLSSLPCEKKEKISTNKKQLKKSSHILKKELLNDFSSKENSNEVWFDTANPIVKDIVAAEQIGKAKHDSKEENMLVKSFASDELTKVSRHSHCKEIFGLDTKPSVMSFRLNFDKNFGFMQHLQLNSFKV